jgi:hypothetical protein
VARAPSQVRPQSHRALPRGERPTQARWHLIDGADEDYREVRAGELLRDEMLSVWSGRRATVRSRASKTGQCAAAAAPAIRKVAR